MKIAKLFIVFTLIALSSSVFAEGDPGAGKEKSMACAACHGAEGISKIDLWPNLAGQKYGYLVKQLKAFRDGTRTEATMTPIANQLSNQDIMDLAAYYSGLDP